MHSQLTPFRICRNALIGVVLAVVLFIVAMCLPFYTYSYFASGETMKFIDIANANNQILIPFISCIVCLILLITSLVFMIVLSKKKAFMVASKTMSLISAFVFLGLFIIALCRLWVIPYEFGSLAYQILESGYLVYLLFLFFSGCLSCYMLGIHEK